MSVEAVLSWMESSALANMVLDHYWVFPTLETLHFIGLILLIGSLYVVDLRFLGIARSIPLGAVTKLIPISALGFAINLTTGILFLFADPFRYYPNLAFRLKMLAVLLAGLNLLWFKKAVNWEALEQPGVEPGIDAKATALISMILWTSVIVLGRLIPYLE